jgi:hypothetical protein
MIDLSKLYVNLDLVLNKRASLGLILSPYEIEQLKRKAEKNHWDDNTIIANIYRYLKENISDFLHDSDFIDANIIIESDPFIIKAMELMSTSQSHAEVLLVDKESKYPGSWVNSIASALKELDCREDQFNLLVWDAYFMKNYEINKNIPGWVHLAETLDDYFDTL